MIRATHLFLALLAATTGAWALDGDYSIQTSTDTGLAVGMNVYLPPGYHDLLGPRRSYPLWVFIPGAGEIGNPADAGVVLAKSTVWGPSHEIRYNDRDYPFIVVTPISDRSYSSLPTELDAMVVHLQATLRVDVDRVYFSGLCVGASGVMEYSQVNHQRLAAILPVITQTPTVRTPERLRGLPTWLFHAYGDPSVSRQQTITWADAIDTLAPPASCMDTYPFGIDSSGGQTFNAQNQTGSFTPESGWVWRTFTIPADDSLLQFTMLSNNSHEIWQSIINNATVLHWLGRQVRHSPFGGIAQPVPGRVQAEAFDLGGHLIAYRDNTIANTGGSSFHDTVNTFDGTSDGDQVDLAAGGDGTVLTGTEAGEWVDYTINASSGTYVLRLRVAAAAAGGSLRLLRADGSVFAGPVAVPATSGFTTLQVEGIHLDPGVQTLRLAIDQGGFDLDWFEIAYPPGPADVIVDNLQTDKVATTGPWVTTSVAPGYFANDYLSAAAGATASAVFRPTLPRAGDYRIYVQHPSQPSYGTVRVIIDPGDGGATSTILVDEHTNGGVWRALGVFTLPAGNLATATIAVDGSPGYVAADAVRFWEIDPDNHPPAVALAAPDDGTSTTTGTAVALSATASDPDIHSSSPGLQKVEFYADDGSDRVLVGVDTSGSGDPATYDGSFTPMTPGAYLLTAVAYDYSGGVTTSSTRTLHAISPPAGTLAFSSTDYTVVESAGSVTITVQRVGGSGGAVAVDYACSPGSASSADFTPASGTLTWADGDASDRTFTVAILPDDAVEGDETVSLSLANPTGAATAGGPATLTIRDDDVAVDGVLQFSAAAYPQIETNAGTTTVTVTVTCSAGSTGTTSVTWTSSDGSATAGSDYVAGTGTLTFAPGETAKTFTVTILGDTTPEPDETVQLALSSPTGGAVLGTLATAEVVIISDDGHGSSHTTPKSHSCGSGTGFALLLALLALAGAGFTARTRRP
jgi:hypothetical protein